MLVVRSARSEKFDVRTARLDSEHQVQIAMIVTLEEAVSQSHESGVVALILDQFVTYTRTHFLAEQLLMQWYQYPHSDTHAQEHEHFLARLQLLLQSYRSDSLMLTRQMVLGLKDWLLTHIQGPDRGLENYLAERAVGNQPPRCDSVATL